MTINIAVAGGTNVGKTTLIRTLIRQFIGEVDDRASVTTIGTVYFDPILSANFVDTPGFQYPSISLNYLDGETLSKRDKEKIKEDKEAIKSIEACDIVLYVANLGEAPKGSNKDEIDVVLKLQPKVIGILNQYDSTLKGGNGEKVKNRCNLWTQCLNEKGIDKIIVFDSHWDKRSKEQEIYDTIHQKLPGNLKDSFIDGLNKFKKRQEEIRNESYQKLATNINKLQDFSIVIQKSNYHPKGISKPEYEEKILREIYQEIVGFIAYTNKLYEVAAEFPTDYAEEIKIKAKSRVNFSGRIGGSASLSTFLGTIGASFGAVVGALITGILSGGLATIPGAIEGAKFFGAIAASAGSLAVFVDNDDYVEIKIDPEQIEDIFKYFFAVIWGLEHNGFGRNKSLSEEETQNMKTKVEELSNLPSTIDWMKIKYRDIY